MHIVWCKPQIFHETKKQTLQRKSRTKNILRGAMKFMEVCIFHQAYLRHSNNTTIVAVLQTHAHRTHPPNNQPNASASVSSLALSVNHVFCMRAYFTLCGCILLCTYSLSGFARSLIFSLPQTEKNEEIALLEPKKHSNLLGCVQ